jgi:hypothetical protein
MPGEFYAGRSCTKKGYLSPPLTLLWATVRLGVTPFQLQQMARLQPQLPTQALQDMTADRTPPPVTTEFANGGAVNVRLPQEFPW